MRSLLKEHIIMAEDGCNVDFNKVISLSSTASYLWEKIAGIEFDENKLVEMLLEEYDVDRDVAAAEVSGFVASMRNFGLIDD